MPTPSALLGCRSFDLLGAWEPIRRTRDSRIHFNHEEGECVAPVTRLAGRKKAAKLCCLDLQRLLPVCEERQSTRRRAIQSSGERPRRIGRELRYSKGGWD